MGRLYKGVKCIDTGYIFISLREAERTTGTCRRDIARVCKGERKTAGGYRWEFINKGGE